MGRAEPDVRPPGAAIPSAKSISVVEIPLAAMSKFEGAAPFKGRNIVSWKMSTWVGQYAPL